MEPLTMIELKTCTWLKLVTLVNAIEIELRLAWKTRRSGLLILPTGRRFGGLYHSDWSESDEATSNG